MKRWLWLALAAGILMISLAGRGGSVAQPGSGVHDAWYGKAAPYPLVKYVNRASGAAFQLRAITGAGSATAPLAATVQPAAAAQSGSPPLNVPFLVAAFLVQYPLMIVFPLLLGWWLRRRYAAGWGIFSAGAATFILSQVVHLPLNWALGLLGGGRGLALWPLVPMALVAGLSAGVCEEGARWLVLRFFLKRMRSWHGGLQFGAGHGGAEAIIYGVLALLTLIEMIVLRSLDLSTLNLAGATPGQVQALIAQYWATPWTMSVLAGAERVFAIILQITMALLVVRAVARRQPLYLLAAIGLHAAADFWAVWAAGTIGPFWVEAGVVVFAALALVLILRLREPLPAREPMPSAAPEPTAAELAPRTLSTEELARRAEASRYE